MLSLKEEQDYNLTRTTTKNVANIFHVFCNPKKQELFNFQLWGYK